MTLILRPYQIEALQSVKDNFQKGISKQLIVLPTGSGKTVIFSHIPKVLENSLPMLVIAHRSELLIQATEKILWSNPQFNIQTEKAEEIADLTGDVVVASVQTLGRSDSKRLLKFPKDYFKTIIVDEAHHAAAESYRRVLDYFTPDFLLGVTATPQRSDSVRLTDVFQEITYYKNIQDLIKEGYLSRIIGYRVKTNTDISEVETSHGDYSISQLENKIDNPERNALVVKSYHEFAPNKKAVVFASGVNHAKHLATSFTQNGTPARVVLGDTPDEERKQILLDFKNGQIKVIVNVGVLTEGFDEPSIDAIIIARPTRSTLLYTQIVGRGTRIFEGKEHCIIIDIADATIGKKPLGLPTLLGMPAEFDLKGQDLIDVADKYKELEDYCLGQAIKVLSLQDIELAYKQIDLFMPPPINEILYTYSRFIWAEVGEDDYHLSITQDESIRIYVYALGRWTTSLRNRTNNLPVDTILGHPEDMREAFVRTDRWITNNRSYNINLIDATAIWRSDSPTDKQQKMLKRIGVPLTADMTKGIASQIISQYYQDNPKPVWLQNKIASKKWD